MGIVWLGNQERIFVLKDKYKKLKATPLSACVKEISKVSRGHLANEYGDRIEDYSQVMSPLTNRFIKPYVTSETHGPQVFDWLVNFIKGCKVDNERILDLGCGAGELLSKLKDDFEVYGTTIHLGEVKYGREVYGLEDICPIDMREIGDYFEEQYFDYIILHCSLHFISQEEREILVNDTIWRLLAWKGLLIIVDYKGDQSSGIKNISPRYRDITPKEYNTMGNLTVLMK